MEGEEIIEGADESQEDTDWKKLYGESTKGAQKLLNEKKQLTSTLRDHQEKAQFYEKVIQEVKNVALDPSHMNKLPEKERNYILQTYYNGMTLEQYNAGEQPEQTASPQVQDPEEIKKMVEKEFNDREVRRAYNQFIKKANLDEEQKAKFEENYTDITEGKRLNPENVKKYLKISFAETIGYEKPNNVAAIASVMATGGGSGGGESKKTGQDALLEDMRSTSKMLGVGTYNKRAQN